MDLKERLVYRKYLKAKREAKLWEKEKVSCETLEKIREEKYNIKKNRIKLSTTKRIVAFLIINFTIVEAYSLWVMVKLQDLSALSVLVTSVIGEVIAFAIYALKATKENTKGGITYDLALQNEEQSQDNVCG